jgi:beta-phosphoglucomutase-like phosphatase (HAD superfamily)
MSTLKGPWQYKATPGDCWTVHDCEGTAIMGDAQYYPWVPGEADQWRLIAAAPELLEALRELLIDMQIAQSNMTDAAKRDRHWVGCAEAIQPRVDAAKSAIAKATGETP